MRILVIAIFAAANLLSSPQASASMCLPTYGWLSEIIDQQEIFYGTVVETKVVDNNSTSRWREVKTKFNIKERLTGKTSNVEYLHHTAAVEAADTSFKSGQSFWVYAKVNSFGELTINPCMRNFHITSSIINYQQTGQDIYIPYREVCYGYQSIFKIDYNYKNPDELAKQECKFWSPENMEKRRRFEQNYTFNQRGQ